MTAYTKKELEHVKWLLQETTVITKKYKFLEQKTGKAFNIFQICDIDEDEVKNCRMLYELLSPFGTHGQGMLYLELFFEIVLRLSLTETELQTAKVYREYTTDEYRRIDLLIETKSMFIPIEVKINASEQEKQCFDYYEEAKRHNKRVLMYYLTKDGSAPSEYSTGNQMESCENKIAQISFADDILKWLSACLKQPATVKLTSVREVMLQYMEAVRKFTDQMEDEQRMEIKALLMESPENMKSAIAIQKGLDDAKDTLMRKLFEAIEEKVGEKYQKLENEYDYAYTISGKDAVYGHNHYRNSKKYNPPGLSYYYKTNQKPYFDIWVRIAIWGDIYLGYCSAVDGVLTEELPLSHPEFKKIISVNDMRIDASEGHWIYWEYCENKKGESPDFYNGNDAWFDLFDDKNFDTFVNNCANRIIKLLEQ